MENTAGDLNHGLQEVSQNIERQITRSASQQTLARTISHTASHHTLPKLPPSLKQEHDFEKQGLDEKSSPPTGSSETSSEDVVQIEKLDSRVIKIGDVKEGEEAWAHLPPHEKEIIKRQLEVPPVTVTYRTLYRYATRNDMIIVAISALMAIAGGAVMPLMTVR